MVKHEKEIEEIEIKLSINYKNIIFKFGGN